MQQPLHLRNLTAADFPFADSVRALAGWNQTLADWERFLAAEPQGCFLAEWEGAPAGTATTTVYGSDLGWIGMVLVHPDYRRRGIGRALLLHCIEHLRRRGIRCIKLDATPAGKLVYDQLGFCDEWPLKRWTRQGQAAPASLTRNQARASAGDEGLRAWQPGDLEKSAALDQESFGVKRRKLLAALASRSSAGLVFEDGGRAITGFGFARAGAQALYLGPVVARSAREGLALVEALLRRGAGRPVYWDIPDQNQPAVGLARDLGFSVQRPLLRMFFGQNAAPGDPRRQFALAGPEVG